MNQSRFVSAQAVLPSRNSLVRPGLHPVHVSLSISSAKQHQLTISIIGPQCHALPRATTQSSNGITGANRLTVITCKADQLESAAL